MKASIVSCITILSSPRQHEGSVSFHANPRSRALRCDHAALRVGDGD